MPKFSSAGLASFSLKGLNRCYKHATHQNLHFLLISLFCVSCGSGNVAPVPNGEPMDVNLGSAFGNPVNTPDAAASGQEVMVAIPSSATETESPVESESETVAAPMVAIALEDASCDADPELFKQALLALTNRSRQSSQVCGNSVHDAVLPLEWDDTLSRAAHNHSSDMSTHNFFSHTGSDGSSAFQRVTMEGFPSGNVGENIAAGQTTTGSVQDSWMNSTGHCQNIMLPSYTHMGASCVVNEGSDFRNYWTVVFGRR